jgi:hypothetical protein
MRSFKERLFPPPLRLGPADLFQRRLEAAATLPLGVERWTLKLSLSPFFHFPSRYGKKQCDVCQTTSSPN